MHQELYDDNNLNVKVQVCGVLAPETSGWFKNEINKPEDLAGLKMRFFGLGALVMEKLGVSTVGLPVAKYSQQLKRVLSMPLNFQCRLLINVLV